LVLFTARIPNCVDGAIDPYVCLFKILFKLAEIVRLVLAILFRSVQQICFEERSGVQHIAWVRRSSGNLCASALLLRADALRRLKRENLSPRLLAAGRSRPHIRLRGQVKNSPFCSICVRSKPTPLREDLSFEFTAVEDNRILQYVFLVLEIRTYFENLTIHR
jgi:hypothetical protein